MTTASGSTLTAGLCVSPWKPGLALCSAKGVRPFNRSNLGHGLALFFFFAGRDNNLGPIVGSHILVPVSILIARLLDKGKTQVK